MKRFTLYIFTLCLFTMSGYAQPVDTVATKKVSYFFSVQSGAVFGDQVTFSSSTIHGVKLGRKLRVGAGIGFDSYKDAQTMPVFGSASWDLFGKKNVVFVQMNYGWSPYAWSPTLKDTYAFDKIKGGEIFSAMIGYRIASENIRISIMTGFKHQEVTVNYNYPIYYDYAWSSLIWSGYPTNSQIVDKTMNRFSMSIAVGWR